MVEFHHSAYERAVSQFLELIRLCPSLERVLIHEREDLKSYWEAIHPSLLFVPHGTESQARYENMINSFLSDSFTTWTYRKHPIY